MFNLIEIGKLKDELEDLRMHFENFNFNINEDFNHNKDRIDNDIVEIIKRLDGLYEHFNLEYNTEEKGVIKKEK